MTSGIPVLIVPLRDVRFHTIPLRKRAPRFLLFYDLRVNVSLHGMLRFVLKWDEPETVCLTGRSSGVKKENPIL